MKLFASDLDGTLLNQYHKADDTINEGIKKIQASGHIFSICTGRNPALASSAGLVPSYMICMNGACILDPKGELLMQHPLDRVVLRFLLQVPSLKFEFQTLSNIYSTGDRDSFTEIYRQNQLLRHRDVKKDMEKNLKKYTFDCDPEWILNQTIYKVNLHYANSMEPKQVERLVHEHQDTIINAPSTESLAELTGKEVTKANAIRELAQFLHIDSNDIYVYGDGLNDISMLEAFQHSYSPCNGNEKAKKAAHSLLGPFEEYSVIKHMLEMIQE